MINNIIKSIAIAIDKIDGIIYHHSNILDYDIATKAQS